MLKINIKIKTAELNLYWIDSKKQNRLYMLIESVENKCKIT